MINISRLLVLVLIAALPACSSIHVNENTQQPNRSFDAVNGSVYVGANSSVKNASSVNGRVYIEDNVTVNSADTVNGNIYLGRSVQVLKSLDSVNGDIEVKSGSRIGGKIETVNGDIDLKSTVVEADIITVSGDVTLTGNTHIKGKVHVQNKQVSKLKIMGFKITPEITIGPNVVIDGPLIHDSRVDLNIDPKAKIQKVIYTDNLK